MTQSAHDRGEPLDLVELETAPNPLAASLIAGIVRNAGVPAYVAGGLLTDEFALSQRLMNLQGVKVQVPRARLAEAREALAAAREAGARMAAGEPIDEEDLQTGEGEPTAEVD